MKKTKNDLKEKVKEYLKKPYRIEREPDPDRGFAVWIRELPGCISYGETEEEALKMIKEAMELWIETALKRGVKIPDPQAAKKYTGKFLVRIPSSLHERLVEMARDEGISLNSLIISLLSEGVASRSLKSKFRTIENRVDKIEKSFLWKFEEKKRKETFQKIKVIRERYEQGRSA